MGNASGRCTSSRFQELRSLIEAVLAELVDKHDLKWADVDRRPIARVDGFGEDAESSWCRYLVDLSAIGLPSSSPLVVRSREGDNFLSWSLGSVPLAYVPKARPTTETADLLHLERWLTACFQRP